MQCYITPLLALGTNPSHIVRMFLVLSSHSLDCISCAIKKCAIPLSEPLDDHRPRRLKWFEEVYVTGAGDEGGIVTPYRFRISRRVAMRLPATFLSGSAQLTLVCCIGDKN